MEKAIAGLTDPAFNHTINMAPDFKHFIDVAQTHDKPPVHAPDGCRWKVDRRVGQRAIPASSTKLGLKRVELFTFKAADGKKNGFFMGC